MAQSPAEINDWMTAISNTLPPPPHLPLEDKRLSLTPQQQDGLPNNRPGCHPDESDHVPNGCAGATRNGTCHRASATNSTQNPRKYDSDYTVLSGVCIDWGHGWGWGQAAWATQAACHESAMTTSSVFCHSADDYVTGGYDEVDWSAFGDFSF